MKIHSSRCSFLISLVVILLSEQSSAADYQYEACGPINCGLGPNVTFPFYIPGRQEPYCGFPGFHLNCSSEGYPVLRLPDEPENEYVVEQIHYRNRSFHVYNAAVLRPETDPNSCLPGLQNTTLPSSRFGFAANTTRVYLFSGCPNRLPVGLPRYNVSNCGNWDLAIYGGAESLGDALRVCERNVVLPVGGEGRNGISNVTEVLRNGFELNWTASDCGDCEDSGGRCGFNSSTYHFRCFCPDRPHSRICLTSSRNGTLQKIFLIGGVTLAALTFTVAFAFIFIRRGFPVFDHRKEKTKQEHDLELFLKDYGSIVPKRYKYSALKKMTNSFLENLGNGGYGSVYKGILSNGQPVAVKILNESKGNGEEFMNEVASISRTSHVNVVTLVGFCFEGSKRALIYDFMPNGSLEKYLQNTSRCGLGWETLFEISLGIARGLDYLHRGCNTRILHFDIKPHNILLDKDFNPKISDFGLAKLCPNRSSIVSMLVARGTIGYIAPEVFCQNFGTVSYKSDVYSYGMMILEIAGEKRRIDRGDVDRTSETYFPDYIYRRLESDMEMKSKLDEMQIMNEDESKLAKRKLTIVGLWCIQTDPKDRPTMSKVVEMLEGKLESLQVPSKPYISSPPRMALDFSTTSISM